MRYDLSDFAHLRLPAVVVSHDDRTNLELDVAEIAFRVLVHEVHPFVSQLAQRLNFKDDRLGTTFFRCDKWDSRRDRFSGGKET